MFRIFAAALLIVVLAATSSSAAKEHPPIPSITAPQAPRSSDQKEEPGGGPGGVCLNCHQDKLKQPVVHPAVTAIGCEGCHEASQKNGKWTVQLVAEGNELCFTCHDDKKAPAKADKSRRHPPTVEGECLVCHDPHGSKKKFMLQGSVEEISDENLCFTCHIDIQELTKKKTVHGALMVAGCSTCHQTHKSGDPSNQQFAFHLVKSAPALCLECHDATDKTLISAHAGQPFQNAVCSDCHNPHGSDRDKLIRTYAHPPFEAKTCEICHNEPKEGKVSLIEDGKKELCFMCHDDKKDLLEKAKVKHSYFDAFDDCTTCHSPHATDQPKWLKKPVRAMCGTCHEDEAVGFKQAHGPIEATESCAICHEPHASDFPLHLRDKIENICITCHRENRTFKKQEDGELLLFGKISVPESLFDKCPRIPLRSADDRGHPFMNHPVSGKNTLRPESGDLNCTSCHSPHGFNQGRNMLKMPGNALCVSCHGDTSKPGADGKAAEVKR